MNKIELLEYVVNTVDKGSSETVSTIIPLLKESGITSGMHVGKQKEIEGFFDNKNNVIEWFLGQYMKIIESQSWFAVNSLINQTYSWLEKNK